jgi:hypothetical protein
LYLGDLPTVLEYVRKTASRYTELKPLVRLLDAGTRRRKSATPVAARPSRDAMKAMIFAAGRGERCVR